MGNYYLTVCDRCQKTVNMENSLRWVGVAYGALVEFKDPEIVIAHEIEFMEAENEQSFNDRIKVLHFDRHLKPENGCFGSPRSLRFVEEDFKGRIAYETLSR